MYVIRIKLNVKIIILLNYANASITFKIVKKKISKKKNLKFWVWYPLTISTLRTLTDNTL